MILVTFFFLCFGSRNLFKLPETFTRHFNFSKPLRNQHCLNEHWFNFTSMERKSERTFEADDDSWELLVEKVHCLIHPDILGSTPRLAHPDQRDHHLHLRLQVRHPAQRGYLRLGPTDQVCPGKRRRNLWMPGNLFLIWFDLWGHPLQMIELHKILGAYC